MKVIPELQGGEVEHTLNNRREDEESAANTRRRACWSAGCWSLDNAGLTMEQLQTAAVSLFQRLIFKTIHSPISQHNL